MALNLHGLRALSPYLRDAKILSLGYPDILVTAYDVSILLKIHPKEFSDSGAWHGVSFPLPETRHVLKLLGSQIKCVDIVKSRNCEDIVDLNHPHDLGSYDLVIDPGTVEHCFNIGQAIMNAANAVKPGGHIFHTPPMTMLNHGFYNLCPTLLYDFYTDNGWEIETLQARDAIGNGRLVNINATGRFTAPSECSLFCLAKRTSDNALKFPVQTKYKKNPMLK